MTRSKTAESLVSALVILLITLLLILASGDRPAGSDRSGASVLGAGTSREVPASADPAGAADLGADIRQIEGAS